MIILATNFIFDRLGLEFDLLWQHSLPAGE